MNNTVIQENSGINSFYAKVYSLVGMGIGISALVSALMLTIFQDVIYSVIMANSWIFYLAIFAELVLVWVALPDYGWYGTCSALQCSWTQPGYRSRNCG